MCDEQQYTPWSLLEDDLENEANPSASLFFQRISRYGPARKRTKMMEDWLRSQLISDNPFETRSEQDKKFHKYAERLASCSNYLLFRYYPRVEQTRLRMGMFCQIPALCPLCAIRRTARLLSSYLPKYEQVIIENPHLKPIFITLTVVNGGDLNERLLVLRKALKKLKQRGQSCRRQNRTFSEWAKVLGSISTIEITNENSGWHPHVHIVALVTDWIDRVALSKEWEKLTSDSYIIDVRRFGVDMSPAQAFCELFKYTLKFSTLSFEKNWQAFNITRGDRLISSAGLFWVTCPP